MGEESVEKVSMEIEEADDRKTEDNEHDKYQAHPMIWVPTSLLVALLLAVCNVISTYLSNYGLKLRELHSPSTIICCSVLVCIVSYDYKKGNNYALKTHQNPGYFDWFFEIYYKVRTECSGDNPSQQLAEKSNSADAENQSLLQVKIIKTLRWEIILLTIFAGILSILTAWCIILAFHYAVIANMNSGVVMSAFSIKPVILSIAFSFLYKQKLKAFEIVGIVVLMISVVMIAFSTDNIFQQGVTTNAWYTIISIGFLLFAILCLTTSTVVLKHFLAYGDNQVNVSAYYNFYNIAVGIIFFILFLVEIANGFEFSFSDFMISQLIGFLWGISMYLMAYVNLRGKAGTSDALIETSIVYQTILDAIIFGRIPNTIQIIGVVIAFTTSAMIVLGYQYSEKKKE